MLITQIRLESGDLTTDTQTINDTFRDFYCNLYKSESQEHPNQFNPFFDNLPILTLDSDAVKTLEEVIALDEIQVAIKSMRSGKSPGLSALY